MSSSKITIGSHMKLGMWIIPAVTVLALMMMAWLTSPALAAVDENGEPVTVTVINFDDSDWPTDGGSLLNNPT